VTYAPPIYAKDVTAPVAALQIMAMQYRIMVDNAAAARWQPDLAPIHDMRVAMNRLRAALGLFQPLLGNDGVGFIEKILRDVRSGFGPARDAQLWVGFLNSLLQEQDITSDSLLQQYALNETAKMERALVDLQEALTHESFEALCRQLTVLIKRDLPLLADTSSARFAPFASKRLKKRIARVQEEPADIGDMSVEEMHKARKRCKRLRYWAEFAAPVLDKPISELALRAKAVTSAFGAVHDLAVQQEWLKHSEFSEGTIVRDALRNARKRANRDAEKAWIMLRRWQRDHARAMW
jgi:CHAD domain-containing protein